MIINKSYFVGELDIANTNNAHVEARLNSFIEKYEPEFLRLLLGEDLYLSYAAGIVVTGEEVVPAHWVSLQDVDGLKKAIACYVYFYYMRDQFTQTVGLGEIKPKAENATVADPSFKMIRAWNEMARWVRRNTLVTYLNTNVGLYPGWMIPQVYAYYENGMYNTSSVLSHRFGIINPVIPDL